MVPRIPVIVTDGAGRPYMMRVDHTELTPEATVAKMNSQIKHIGFKEISFALATEEQYAEWCRENHPVVEKQRMEQM